MICWLSGHRSQHSSCTASRRVETGRRQSSAFRGIQKLLWGRLRSRDQTHLESGINLVNILLQVLCYPPLVQVLPSNLGMKTKKIEKRSLLQNLRLPDHVHWICHAV